ncbi:MAG: hypothetical protein VB018_04005 [Lachnospiraceae bacterium]|nr:hypothetical protein [Lachnospiraceae bacterium]
MIETRIGYISAYNETKKTYRVNFPKLGYVSGEILAVNNQSFEIDTQVLCLYSAEGDGFILGKIGA